MQCWPDVGGSDVWISSWWTPTVQWRTGWHSLKPFNHWHLSEEKDWVLIGYELWPYTGPGYMKEAYYMVPNPSTTRPAKPPEGFYHIHYNARGEAIPGATYTAGALSCRLKDAFIKGDGKGYGKAFPPKGKGKGDQGKGKWGKGKNSRVQRNPKGGKGHPKGKGKGKPKGKVQQHIMKKGT